MIREIIYEDEGRRKLREGIALLCKVLMYSKQTISNGRYTKSGYDISKNIEGKDKYINQGIRLAGEVVSDINYQTGCGTMESARVMEYMMMQCEKLSASIYNPVSLAKELGRSADDIANSIIRDSEMITECDIDNITGDSQLSCIIDEAMKYGDVVIRESMYNRTRLEVMRGMRIEEKLIAGYEGQISGAYVFVTDQVIDRFHKILPVLEKVGGMPLIIVAEGIEGEALTLLNTNIEKNTVNVRAVKAPGFGKRKADILEDLAIITGTHVYGAYEIDNLSEMDIELGMADKVEVFKHYVVVSASGREKEIEDRIEIINCKIEDMSTNYYDKQKLKERIGNLLGTLPVIYVGGDTNTAMKEEKLRAEYAIAYANVIKKYGVVRRNTIEGIEADTVGKTIIKNSLLKAFKEDEISAYLLNLIVKKVSSMVCMWLTTGAVMISVSYDREDRELIKSGVDIDRIRGC